VLHAAILREYKLTIFGGTFAMHFSYRNAKKTTFAQSPHLASPCRLKIPGVSRYKHTIMTKQEAIQFLEIENDNQVTDIFDAVDEKLFQIKNESLQKLAVPLLLKKRVSDCNRITEALIALGLEEKSSNSTFEKFESQTDAISFLENYERCISATKLSIFNARNSNNLKEALESALEIQTIFNYHFPMVFEAFGPFEAMDIPSREATDTGVLLRGLKSTEHSDELKSLIQREAGRLLKIASLG